MARQIGTETRVYCGCGHSEASHDLYGECSFGWCRCGNTRQFVRENGTPVEGRPVFAGYNAKTGSWG